MNEQYTQSVLIFKSSFNFVERTISNYQGFLSIIRPKTTTALAETAIFLKELMDAKILCDDETNYADSWVRHICSVLGISVEFKDAMKLRYFEDGYRRSSEAVLFKTMSVILAIRALEKCGFGFSYDSSPWEELIGWLEMFRDQLITVFKDANANHTGLLFLFLNTVDLLAHARHENKLEILYHDFCRVIVGLKEFFIKGFESSVGLRLFAAELADTLPEVASEFSRGNLSEYLINIPVVLSGKTGLFYALRNLRLKAPSNYHEQLEGERMRNPHLWWIVKAWNEKLTGSQRVGILPYFKGQNMDEVEIMVWGENQSSSISDEEKNLVSNLGDPEIKECLYNYFTSHPLVLEPERNRLSQELTKSHGPGEIADFTVKLEMGSGKLIVCIPIKSGKETKGKAATKIALNNIHQIIRPILSFSSHEIVVLGLLISGSTLNLLEFTTQLQTTVNFPIRLYDIDFFTSFLKKQGML